MALNNPLQRITLCLMPALFGVYMPMCTPRVTPAERPWEAPMSQLWEKPLDLETRDLYHGPWGAELAPDPGANYTFAAKKQHGTNPGVIVTDPAGREWSVKQAPHNHQGDEGPVEVVLSRILSAVGYHQPPVYFLPSFTMTDATGTHTEPGGRFRLKTGMLAKRGDWSWQQNPFVGTRPYQGLLVILLMFDSSDLKNVNNSLYEVRSPGEAPRVWYVVRDLGTALGETGRLTPKRNDITLFEEKRFINGVRDGYVEFHYHGWHQELLQLRITPADVHWASDLLTGLSHQQWRDAFRAGGYAPDEAERFIRRILAKVAEGERLDRPAPRPVRATAADPARGK
jgi:hypothetical protein